MKIVPSKRSQNRIMPAINSMPKPSRTVLPSGIFGRSDIYAPVAKSRRAEIMATVPPPSASAVCNKHRIRKYSV